MAQDIVNEIGELIQLLQTAAQLQLERDQTDLELEEVEQRRAEAQRAETEALRREVDALKREKRALEAEIDLLKRTKQSLVGTRGSGSTRKPPNPRVGFKTGDKVYTTKPGKHTIQRGIVTKVITDKIGQVKVWFEDEQGRETWRAPINLRKEEL